MAAEKKLPIVTIFSEYPSICDEIKNVDATIPLQFVAVTNKQGLAFSVFDRQDPEISETAMNRLKEAEILVSDPNLLSHIYQQLPHTKWVQSTWAGQDEFFKHLDYSKPLPEFSLCKLGQELAVPLGEYVIGRLIAHERRFYKCYEAQKAKIWGSKIVPYRLLSELTIGILGVGDIGSQIAEYCKTFGMKVWGMVRRELPIEKRSCCVDRYCLTSELPVLLSNCDVVCNVLPSTPKTIGFLSGDVLADAKEKKPIFINVGRGDVMDEASIIKAIRENWISHAILDVQPIEPIPQESPLWSMKEITISPHEAGLTFGKNVAAALTENYWRYVRGEPLKYVVDMKAGY
ncbi:glyoxylate/hydroxypyruvate reductase A-like isoform X2 [Anneissia japonica]|nr:glyoxylate/hydroxypyruvate reductase A-like isoform X2 [Anneissia japonica]